MVLNKEILQTLRFDFPLTLSGLGLSTTALVTRSVVDLGLFEVRAEVREAVSGRAWFRISSIETKLCSRAVYLHLGLGFIQMLTGYFRLALQRSEHI